MTQKFHIDKNGKPAPCRATKRPCPLGGAEVHFDSIEEAQAHVDTMNAKEYGLLSNRNGERFNAKIVEVYNELEKRGYTAGLSPGTFIREIDNYVYIETRFDENGNVEMTLNYDDESIPLDSWGTDEATLAEIYVEGIESDEDYGDNYIHKPHEVEELKTELNNGTSL